MKKKYFQQIFFMTITMQWYQMGINENRKNLPTKKEKLILN